VARTSTASVATWSALETGEVNVGEYRWAYEEIQRWIATHASLARLGAVLAANAKQN
jgi:hypothetical protein